MIKKLQNIARYTRYLYSQKLVEEVIKIFKEHRVAGKLSHEKLADLAAIHRTSIGHFENGLRKPSLFVFIKIARALKMDPSELLKQAEARLRAVHITGPVLDL